MYEYPLILINQENNMYFPPKVNNATLVSLYSNNNKICRIYRKLILKFSVWPLEYLLFYKWIHSVKNYKTIIVFDTGNAFYIIKMLKKRYPKHRIILWYWNSVTESIDCKKFKKLDIEMWSFDPSDCNKYKMFYNNQFFIEENKPEKKLSNYVRDVFYVGVDKNRGKLLSELKVIFEKQNISYFFNLVQYKNISNKSDIPYQSPLIYKDVLNYINESKVIIDLVAEWQTGLTLRPVEALFLRKKLITNMPSIVQYDLYNPRNIFVLGNDDINSLKDFITSDYDASNNITLEKKYSFQGWVHHFFEYKKEEK